MSAAAPGNESGNPRARAIGERIARAHIPVLDGVRGVAVLLVMVLHFTIMKAHTVGETVFHNIAHAGWIGVDLFFVLSGFLITGILYDARGGEGYFSNFYARRALRIFPLYYAYLAVLFLVVPMVHPGSVSPEGAERQVWLWTYLSNVLFARVGWEGMPEYTTHLWSLAIEEQFYLVWPLCVFFLRRTRLLQLCVLLIVGALALRFALQVGGASPVASYAFTLARVDTLATGALIAVLARSPKGRVFLSRHAGMVLLGSAATLALVTAAGALSGPGFTLLPTLDPLVQGIGYSAIALGFGGALTLVLSSPASSLAHRVLTTNAMVSLGKYSYALYLIHVPLRSVVAHAVMRDGRPLPTVGGSQVPAQIALICFGVAVSYALALVSWHMFEKHFLALKRFFPSGRTAGRTLPPPVPAPPDGALGEWLPPTAVAKSSSSSDG